MIMFFNIIIRINSQAVGVRYCLGYRNGLVSPISAFGNEISGVKEFFSWILILKMDVKINLRITTKNHVADSKIGSPLKSILEPIELTSSFRQPGS